MFAKDPDNSIDAISGEAALMDDDMFGGEVRATSPDKRRYVKASGGVVDEGVEALCQPMGAQATPCHPERAKHSTVQWTVELPSTRSERREAPRSGDEGSPAVAEPLEAPHKGRLIVLEGLDGSGKETQAGLLRASLIEQGIDLRSVSFPRYDSASSALVRMYLGGQFGSKPDDVNAYAASTFYAVDRYASYKSDWKVFHDAGGVVLADRYTTSNAVHQCAKLPHEEWDTYLDWLFDFEYRLLGVPEPDLVVYLRVDPDVSRKLLDGRIGDGDIHEQDAEYLARCREVADHCAKRFGWTVVECSPDKTMRSIEDIHGELEHLVSALLSGGEGSLR